MHYLKVRTFVRLKQPISQHLRINLQVLNQGVTSKTVVNVKITPIPPNRLDIFS
jgi:hypothetical protein